VLQVYEPVVSYELLKLEVVILLLPLKEVYLTVLRPTAMISCQSVLKVNGKIVHVLN
jgi:hypothetical protein